MSSPRLIMVSGSASGAGKSALSAVLAAELAARGHAVHFLSDDDLLAMDSFAHFERLLGPTDPETHRADRALLRAARTLVEDTLAAPEIDANAPAPVVITDALLPGFFWLFGRYDAARVKAIAGELAQVLSPLEPLLVYLRGEPTALVARAAADRGADWPARMATWVSRWNVPHYPLPPPKTLDEVLLFWSWIDAQTLELLPRWEVASLVLDTFQPLNALRDAVLGALDTP